MKSIYICTPTQVFIEKHLRTIAKSIQTVYEERGYVVINPFETMDALERSYHLIAQRDPMPEDYLRERLANVEFCSEIILCNNWADDSVCMNEVDHAIMHGLKFRYLKK